MTQSPIRRVTIGRRPDLCDVVVPHSGVSGQHCALGFDVETGRWRVHDLNSRNGTWAVIEGRAFRVAPDRPLDVADGVMLRMGPTAAVRVTAALVDPVVRPRAFKGPRTVDGQGRGELAGQAVERFTLSPVSSEAISDLLASTERIAGLSVACRGLRVQAEEPPAPGLPAAPLPGIDLVLRAGELVGLAGEPDGFAEALLETLGGQRAPSAGAVRIGGHPVVARPDGFAPWAVLVAPDDVPPGHLTVREALLQRAHDALGEQLAPPVVEARVLQVAQRLDLMAELDAVIAARGTLVDAAVLRRIQIGEALMGDPAVLLLRAPLRGLAPGAVDAMMGILRSLADDGTTVVLTLEEAPSRAVFEALDRVLLSFQGVTAWFGPAWPAAVNWMRAEVGGDRPPQEPAEAWAPLHAAQASAAAEGAAHPSASLAAFELARRFAESPWYRDAQTGEEAVRLPGLGTPPELPLPPEPPRIAPPAETAGPRVTRTTRLGAVPLRLSPPAPEAPEPPRAEPAVQAPQRTGTQEFLVLDRGVPDAIALEWFDQAVQGLRPLPPPPTIQRPPTIRSAPGRLSGGVAAVGPGGSATVAPAPAFAPQDEPARATQRRLALLIAVAVLGVLVAVGTVLLVAGNTGSAPPAMPTIAASPPDGMVLVQPGHVALDADGHTTRLRAADARRMTVGHGLFVDATPVTRSAYEALVGLGGSAGSRECADCPATGVNWFEALRYANARSAAEGLQPCYRLEDCGARRVGLAAAVAWQCARVAFTGPPEAPLACEGHRLPTEAEWMLLAADGAAEPVAADGRDRRVGQGTPNPDGVHDMGTLVAEWTADAHTPVLRPGPFVDVVVHDADAPEVPRVIRGGRAGRAAAPPAERSADVGFRLVRTVLAGERSVAD